MAKLEEKLGRFEEAVMNQAKQKSQEILESMQNLKDREITSAEDTALSSAYELIQGEVSEITVEASREISQKRLKQKQEYLLKRAAFEKSVFDIVKTHLLEYTQTDAYKEYLKAAAQKLSGDFKGMDVTLMLRTADRPLEALVRESFGAPCKVEFTGAIAIGGILLKDNQKGYVSDLSLDTRLTDQHDWFYQNCKL